MTKELRTAFAAILIDYFFALPVNSPALPMWYLV